ncbi:hypothetical protein QFC19_008690 [Naganishia cerealis]|uniref:Uncharacterized protein n=1 Tax=Naganishia cerealis TaxID=610337 RepID=A0ACC2V1T7_9TREE|nr:hypothetical protein QFC19_008690 [Naganishia cerealis]
MRSALLPFLVLLAAAAATAQPQRPLSAPKQTPALSLLPQALLDELDQLRAEWGIKGASVAVVKQDQETGKWKENVFGLGVADRWDNPVTDETLFSIASNSKLFTALASGLIVANESARGHDARLMPTTKIKDIVPGWALMDPIASDGTDLIDLLSDNLLRPLGMSDTTYDLRTATDSGKRADGFLRRKQNITACIEEGKVVGGKYSAACLGETVSNGWFQPPEYIEWNAGPGGVITPKTYGLAQSMYTYRGHNVIDHGGSDPGQMSQVMRIPEMGLGVAVMVNDDAWGTMYTDLVRWRVVDYLLGLDPVDWRSKLQQTDSRSKEAALPPARPENATMPPAALLRGIQGTYVDKAYGTIVVCAVPGTFPDVTRTSSKERHDKAPEECKDTLANNPFPVHHPSSSAAPIPTFIARYEKFWLNYLEFTHHNGTTFLARPSTFYPETNLNIIAADLSTPFEVVFERDGMALFGNVWGAGAGVPLRQPREGAMKEAAEVWFEKR